jgi:PAS domain S-box-containing protein
VANERILVVDDEQGVVRSCVRILQRQGFVVSGKTDSLSVPELLRQETFDLLLTDIKMPKIDGLELLRIAKEIDPHVTVVLITGYGTMEDAIRAIRLGAQGFLMKPFDTEELVSTVTESLSRRALLRDSLRLQTLLPLLEINQILQVSGGEISLVKRILEVALRSTGATRIAWLRCLKSSAYQLVEAAVACKTESVSQLPEQAIINVLNTARPVWVLVDGALTDNPIGQPNVKGALLPLVIKGEIVGILTAETGGEQTGPFGQISLDLLTLLTGQLTIVLENVQLFQQTETLRAFNEDIIKNMTNGLIAVDLQGQVTAFNPAASAMLGYQPQAVLHQFLSQAMNGADELVKIFNKTLLTGKPESHREIMVQTHEGRQLPISVNIAPLGEKKNGQEPAGVVGVIEDLSELKALEDKRRRLDRLAALGEMAAVVAHEIRNPVASIAAGVEYLIRNAPSGSIELEGGSMILSEVKRVNRILEDILFVARPLQLELRPEVLPDIIRTVLQRCQPQIQEHQIVTSFQCEDHLPLLYVDSQRLEQVFTNLIINATQAMLSGGQLKVHVMQLTGQEEGKIQVSVTDTGSGISPEAQQRIFEPFFTTKARGTGLGLSIARRIIEEHHGTITVETKEGLGTSFIIQLPIT